LVSEKAKTFCYITKNYFYKTDSKQFIKKWNGKFLKWKNGKSNYRKWKIKRNGINQNAMEKTQSEKQVLNVLFFAYESEPGAKISPEPTEQTEIKAVNGLSVKRKR